jgi:hypothetical protein
VSRGARRTPARAVFLAAMAAVTAAPGALFAEETPLKSPSQLTQRTATIALEKKAVVMTVSYKDAIDDAISKKLLSGLPTTIAMRGYVFKDSGGDPVALAVKSCKIVYDLWDEVFRVTVTQAGGSTTTVAVNVEGVLRNCGEAKKIPVMERSSMKDTQKYFVAVLVEVNPVSADMLDRIKRWVTRPNGSTSLSSSDSLFGSFVGLFVTRIQSADKRVQFRTQAFLPPSAAAATTAAPSASAAPAPAPTPTSKAAP